jgi:hypothetical protein
MSPELWFFTLKHIAGSQEYIEHATFSRKIVKK